MPNTAAVALASLVLASCAVDPLDEDAEQAGTVTQSLSRCSGSFTCGAGGNSPEIDNQGLHELNLDGTPNPQGFAIRDITMNGERFTLSVSGTIATLTSVRTGAVLAGAQMFGAEINVVNKVTAKEYILRFVGAGTADYWVKPKGQTYAFSTYDLQWRAVRNPEFKSICNHPLADNDAGGFQASHFVMFAGERIDATTKVIDQVIDRRWVNLGCAGSSLAKLHQTGNTEDARVGTGGGISTTWEQRQTFLRMVTADYCGTGDVFTVAGQELAYFDLGLTIGAIPNPAPVLEARWGIRGATCVNTPRVDANPTPANSAVFGGQVEKLIASTCKRPPRCAGTTFEFSGAAWLSANP
jgi:hypothetical protein